MTLLKTTITSTRQRNVARWEVGGDFALTEVPQVPCLRFPKQSVYFALGRQCVVALSNMCRPQSKRRLWVPSYFCFDVIRSWSQWFEIRFYHDDPRWPEPKWATLLPAQSDIVISVNYFGVREPHAWVHWRQKTDVTLIEDHTHDPAGSWALGSQADYAFSSLRKTLPIPDGAVLWSPRGLVLPHLRASPTIPGIRQKRSAMRWKSEYLKGEGEGERGSDLKQKYRKLFHDGEVRMAGSSPAAISAFSQTYLTQGIPDHWRSQRAKNVCCLTEELSGWSVARPLFSKWPKGSSPLAMVLIFSSAAERDRYRSVLSAHDVYCPIHWSGGESPYSGSRDLSSRVLTVPADQRYTIQDMKKVARVLLGIGHGADLQHEDCYANSNR